MNQLELGDVVLTSKGYQPVYAFAHRSAHVWGDFIQIHTETQVDPLEISGQHLVFLANSSYPVRADSIVPGDILRALESPQGALVTRVVSVSKEGLYAPLTIDGTLVVDGIISSCYVSVQAGASGYIEFQNGASTGFTQHFAAHMALAPLRMACLGFSKVFCESVNEDSGLNSFVEVALSMAEFADSQRTSVQIALLLTFIVIFAPILALEQLMLQPVGMFGILTIILAVARRRLSVSCILRGRVKVKTQ